MSLCAYVYNAYMFCGSVVDVLFGVFVRSSNVHIRVNVYVKKIVWNEFVFKQYSREKKSRKRGKKNNVFI